MRSHAAADVVGRDTLPRDAAVSSSWRGQVKHLCSKQVCPPCHASPHGSCDAPYPIKSHCAAVGCKVAQFRCRYAPWMLLTAGAAAAAPSPCLTEWCVVCSGTCQCAQCAVGPRDPAFFHSLSVFVFFLSGTRPFIGFVGFVECVVHQFIKW